MGDLVRVDVEHLGDTTEQAKRRLVALRVALSLQLVDPRRGAPHLLGKFGDGEALVFTHGGEFGTVQDATLHTADSTGHVRTLLLLVALDRRYPVI